MDLLLNLRNPGHLLAGDYLRSDALIAKGLFSGPLPWLVLSDVLITNDREFVGIVLYAEKPDANVAQRFASMCDAKIARYLTHPEAAKLPLYESKLGDCSVLELRWSESEPDQEIATQLIDDWYYPSPHPANGELPWAWGYPQIDSILADMELTLPKSYF